MPILKLLNKIMCQNNYYVNISGSNTRKIRQSLKKRQIIDSQKIGKYIWLQ